MSSPARWFALGLALTAAIACDEEPVGPAPGVLDVVLVAGAAPAGAMLLLIEGGPVDSVETTGWFTASAPYSGVATQVLLAGPVLQGAVARVHVPDRRVRYRGVVREVAEPGTHALLAAEDYALMLVPARP
jgi:hypothetical protein